MPKESSVSQATLDALLALIYGERAKTWSGDQYWADLYDRFDD